MTKVVCPTCGASLTQQDGGGWLETGREWCTKLQGTRYLDDSEVATSGLTWCPDMSDAAPDDWVLLPPGYREQVLKDIEEARRHTPS